MNDSDIIVNETGATIEIDLNTADGIQSKNIHIAITGDTLENCFKYVEKVTEIIDKIKYEVKHSSSRH